MQAERLSYAQLQTDLQSRREAIIEQIRAYPPPIPACDAQFNYLLEQRDLLAVELNRLIALGDAASPQALHEFAATSPVIESPRY